jgi:hypothetical protein
MNPYTEEILARLADNVWRFCPCLSVANCLGAEFTDLLGTIYRI